MLVRVTLVGNRLTGEIRLREGERQANPEGEAARGISSPTGDGNPGSDQASGVTSRRKRVRSSDTTVEPGTGVNPGLKNQG